MKYYYDLHIHSCLSPCCDNDMTPYNLVNMAALNGLDIIALTDHNSCKNCAAAMAIGDEVGVVVIPGAEVNTIEETHVVCYFPNIDSAMDFDAFIKTTLPPIDNVPNIFGEQLIMNEVDNIIGTESLLLINSTSVSINELPEIVNRFSGVCVPAHVDRDSYSVISVLGVIPPECDFSVIEVSKSGNPKNYTEFSILQNSDAHYLADIAERERYIDIKEKTPQSVIDAIRRGKIL